MPNLPLHQCEMRYNVLRDSMKLKSLYGRSRLEEQIAEVQIQLKKTANLPPQNPARAAVQHRFNTLTAEQHYVSANNKYILRWAALHKQETGAEAVINHQIAQQMQQMQGLEAQQATLVEQVAQLSRFASNHQVH